MARPARKQPRELYPDWPDVSIQDDPVHEKLRQVALAVRQAADEGGGSVRRLAERVGMTHSVLNSLVTGASWPNAESVAKLEVALNRRLWPVHKKGM